MSIETIPSLNTVPVEIVYRILDQLDLRDIIFSMHEVCTRLNTIVYSYYQYMVHTVHVLKIIFLPRAYIPVFDSSMKIKHWIFTVNFPMTEERNFFSIFC